VSNQEMADRLRETGRVTDDAALDAAVLGRVRRICARFPEADEGELQSRPLFRVGRRRFAIFNAATSDQRPRWAGSGRSLHFLADPLEIHALSQDGRFRGSPHHGDRGWLALPMDDVVGIDWIEVTELLESAYLQIRPRS
jgi:hypothetical protein